MQIISRKEAIEKGLKKYFTGKPCKRGHVSERVVGNRACERCEDIRRSSEKNRERVRLYSKAHYKANKEYYKQYHQQNKKQINERSKTWAANNKENINEYRRTLYSTDNSFKASVICREILRRVIKATNSTKDTRTYELLGYCNGDLKQSIESKFLGNMTWDSYGDWHIDHIYPVTRYIKDGVEDPAIINHLDNLIPMWAEHNLEKSDRTLEEYLEDRPDLYDLYGRFLTPSPEMLY